MKNNRYSRVTNPRTEAQLNVRSALSENSKMWGDTLTQAQRDTWNAAPEKFKMKTADKQALLAGISLFMKINLNLNKIGIEPISECPDKLKKPMQLSSAMVKIILKPNANDILIWFDPMMDENNFLVVSATKLISRGQTYIQQNSYKKIAVADRTWKPGKTGCSIKTLYENKFGWIYPNKKIGFKFQIIEKETGQASEAVYVNAEGNI